MEKNFEEFLRLAEGGGLPDQSQMYWDAGEYVKAWQWYCGDITR